MRWWVLLLASGCGAMDLVDDDSACLEAGYAISRRTYECTADPDLANARFEKFSANYQCIPMPDWSDGLQEDEPYPPDLYHCAWVIGELACEWVDAYGDDIAAWLNSSPACAYVIEPAGGGA
jgi:hypothetical protein